ncbi:MAG: DUF4364 family protein, partial [Oscillospiraceae bacterium]
MGYGFIRDRLEIKFLILYILSRVIEAVPFETVLDLTLCDDAIEYFDFSDCLADLVRTEHLTLSPDGLYAITEKGRRNSEICESGLPYSVRMRTDKNLTACNRKLRRKSQVKAETVRRPNGTYTVSLSLSDDVGSLLELDMMVAKEDMANALTARFEKAPEQMYNALLEALFATTVEP